MRKIQELMQKVNVNIRNIIALVCIFKYAIEKIILMYHLVPEGNIKLVERMSDQDMMLCVGAVMFFYFGNNKNDVDKMKHEQRKEIENLKP